MEVLDNQNVISQRDPQDALGVIADSATQLTWDAVIEQPNDDGFEPSKIILTGMGGSAQPGKLAAAWLDLTIPFEVVSNYTLPNHVDDTTLVIASSYSGNTEETLAVLDDAQNKGARVVAMANGGKLLDVARERGIPFVKLMKAPQPRYSAIAQLRSIAKILEHYNVAIGIYDEIASLVEPVSELIAGAVASVNTTDNPAKQLALACVGKTPIVYSSHLFAPVAYKWKISFNENAKNTSWWNELPEFSHNEFVGWSSHPIEKPFAIIDLRSDLDHPRVQQRFELTPKLLSGRRPEPHEVWLHGDSVLCQMICGFILGDIVSIYLGVLNGVNPTPVELVEKFKQELG